MSSFLRELGKAVRALESRVATITEVVQPGPAELPQRWQADARARAAQAVDQALDNWEALEASGSSSGGGSPVGSTPSGSGGSGTQATAQ